VVNINDVLEGHVVLDIECVDRLYLNAYIPNLQVGGQVERFCKDRLGQPIASPVIIQKIGNRFRRDVSHFADEHDIPILHLKKPDRTRWDDRKLDHVQPYLEAAERELASPVRESLESECRRRAVGLSGCRATVDPELQLRSPSHPTTTKRPPGHQPRCADIPLDGDAPRSENGPTGKLLENHSRNLRSELSTCQPSLAATHEAKTSRIPKRFLPSPRKSHTTMLYC
jgi:hypothetical protein